MSVIESTENDGVLDDFLHGVPKLWYAYNFCMWTNGAYVIVRLFFGILGLLSIDILGIRTLFWAASYVLCWMAGIGGIMITKSETYQNFLED